MFALGDQTFELDEKDIQPDTETVRTFHGNKETLFMICARHY